MGKSYQAETILVPTSSAIRSSRGCGDRRSVHTRSFLTSRSLKPMLLRLSHRGRNGYRHPSLRTVRALLTHTALQSTVSPSGLTRYIGSLGFFHIEKTHTREEFIWNFKIAPSSSKGPFLVLPLYDCSEPSSHETVKRAKCVLSHVLKVAIPPS